TTCCSGITAAARQANRSWSGCRRRWMASEKLLLAHAGGNGHVEKADHHFIPGLLAPDHGGVGIGIVRVVCGIVVPGDGLQPGSGLHKPRLDELVAELPVKI